MIHKLTGDETAEDFTNDLRERINTNMPYEDNMPSQLLPLEPIVIVDEIILPYTNHRAVFQDGKYLIPVATYTNGCRDKYTMFPECKKWAEIYGIENIYVNVFSSLINEEDYN